MKERYLGDGLYAAFDGWMIKLWAPRGHEEHWVALEPDILENFFKFLEDHRLEAKNGCWVQEPKQLEIRGEILGDGD